MISENINKKDFFDQKTFFENFSFGNDGKVYIRIILNVY